MSSSFDSFDQLAGDSPDASTQSFDDGNVIYDPPLPNQGFDSFSNFADSESIKDSAAMIDSSTSQRISDSSYTPPIYISGNRFSPDPMEFSPFTPEENGKPILAPMEEMQAEEGFALREWRRQNVIRLEEKEKREKELLSQIIDDANDYKIDFYSQRKINGETNKSTNREKEKLFVASQEEFHIAADKNYWKTIAELVPNEVPAIEKKRGKKDQEKQTSMVVIQGPKPGKPTELSRMWHVILKLKHNTPIHLRPSAQLATTKDAKTETPAVTPVAVA